MKQSLVLITLGMSGLVMSSSQILYATLGPCWPFEIGPCTCSYDTSGNYWYFCENHHKTNASCAMMHGPCDIVSGAKCYTNLTSARVRCADSACSMECAAISEQCQITGDLCPSQL